MLFPYLKNLEAKGGVDARTEKLLLYFAASTEVNVSWPIKGQIICVYRLNLLKDWSAVQGRLLVYLDPTPVQ